MRTPRPPSRLGILRSTRLKHPQARALGQAVVLRVGLPLILDQLEVAIERGTLLVAPAMGGRSGRRRCGQHAYRLSKPGLKAAPWPERMPDQHRAAGEAAVAAAAAEAAAAPTVRLFLRNLDPGTVHRSTEVTSQLPSFDRWWGAWPAASAVPQETPATGRAEGSERRWRRAAAAPAWGQGLGRRPATLRVWRRRDTAQRCRQAGMQLERALFPRPRCFRTSPASAAGTIAKSSRRGTT